MTQTALNEYALSHGMGKTVAQMSEAEKVALRYAFVQDQLATATGDFSRTSTGWANQIRILQLQFDSLKAVIGQGLIAALSPVVQAINTVIGRLLSMANALKAVFSMFGKGTEQTAGAVSSQAESMSQLADNSSGAGSALGGAGGAAKKAAKDIKNATTGIDELNIISQDTDSDSGGSGGSGSGGGGGGVDTYDLGEIDTTPIEDATNAMNPLLERMMELAGLVKQGFWDGLGDLSVFDSIRSNIDSIKSSLKEIFTSPDVINAANNYADTVAYNMGHIAGSMVSIGASIVDFLTGSIANYLQQNTERIQDYIVGMFDIDSRLSTLSMEYWDALATVFEVFRSDSAKQIGADIIGIFTDAFMGVSLLVGNFAVDLISAIQKPFTDNAGLISSTLQNLLGVIEPVFTTIKQLVDDTVDKALSVYNSHVSPLIQSIGSGWSQITQKFLEAFNTYILPVIDNLAKRLGEFASSYLQPLINDALDFIGTLADGVREIWENLLVPLIEWLIDTLAPIVADVLNTVIDVFFTLLEKVTEVISGVLKILSGLIDFVVGVFTGDWSRAWEGIKTILSGVWDTMKSLVSLVLNVISGAIKIAWTSVKNIFTVIWNAIVSLMQVIWGNLKNIFSTALGIIRSVIDSVWNTISSITSSIWNNILSFINTIWETIKSTISNAVETVKTNVETIFEGMKNTVINVFDGMWNGIKGAINSILSGVETMVNGVIRALNSMINALNNLSFDVPDWVPGIGGKSFGFSIPNLSEISIPKLANGGYVKANTPQLAMIGDNRHYGEVVAPEDKLQEMVNTAVSMVAGQNNGLSDQLLNNVINILERLLDTVSGMDLTVQIDTREVRKSLDELESRRGYALRG